MIEYSANNSGGNWWLSDDDWKALEQAGWEVEWVKDTKPLFGSGERWLGALATRARREGLSMAEAILEWEQVTGANSSDLGCSCCGAPHTFTEYDADGKYVDSYTPDYPLTGERYAA